MADSKYDGFYAGLIAGPAGYMASYPLDTIKTRLQKPGSQYKGMIDCTRGVWKDGKIRAFYRGLMPPTMNQAPINCVIFGVEHLSDKLLGDRLAKSEMTKHCITGGLAGFAQSVICSPIELIKVHQQVHGTSLSNTALFRKIYINHGIRAGIYRGFGSTVARDAPGFAAYFGIYEGSLDFVAKRSHLSRDEVPYSSRFVVGGTAGVLSFVINYPVDVAKTQIQLDLKRPHMFRHTYDCLLKIYEQRGITNGLYKGMSSMIARAFVCNSVLFCVADCIKEQLRQRHI